VAQRAATRKCWARRLEFVSDLPKTLTGKIRRIELRRLELERTAAGKR
jgi:acetyl-CoA synthetase